MSQGLCPNCDQMTQVGNSPKIGENVICSHCGAESIIVWLNPIELDLPYDDYADDDDDYDYKYEEDYDYYGEDFEDYP
jgi:lysine biosynthesis protein LysW